MAEKLLKSGMFGNTSPLLVYQLYAEQTAGSGTKRTIKVTAKFKVNGTSSISAYGYPCNWKAVVNGVSGSYETLKGNETWRATDEYRSFSKTFTVDVGTTSSKTINIDLYTNHGTYNYWNGSTSASFTVSSTNTAPTMTGYVACRTTNAAGTVITAESAGIEGEIKIPEHISSIYLSWTKATDAEGGTIRYEVQHQRDNGSWYVIYDGTNNYYTHSIGAGNQGSKYDYNVRAYDSAGLKSNTINATQFDKNTFTGNTLKTTSSINYNNSSVTFTYSGEKNNVTATKFNDSTRFIRELTCSGVTVYNNNILSSPITLTIYKGGTVPTGPYILFDDVKNRFSNSSYKGNLTFNLITKNAYGSSKTSSVVMNVDLQTTPNAASNIRIVEEESTVVKTTTIGNKYFIPNGTDYVRLEWEKGSCKLGSSVTYDIYASYGGESWKLIDSGIKTTSYDHYIEKSSKQMTLSYMVRTKTSYNKYADDVSNSGITLDYYNEPTITVSKIVRGSNTAEVPITINSDSSIPNIDMIGNWECKEKETSKIISSGKLESTQNQQKITISGLSENDSYNLIINYNDNTGFSTSFKSNIVSIGINYPMFFVNKYGIGINGEKADQDCSIAFKGNVKVKSPNGKYSTTLLETFNGSDNYGLGVALCSGGLTVVGGGESATNIITEKDSIFTNGSTEQLLLSADENVYIASNCNSVGNKKISTFSSNGNLYVNNAIYEKSTIDIKTGAVIPGDRVYSPNNKPKPTDIGALASNGGDLKGDLYTDNGTYLRFRKSDGTAFMGVGITTTDNAHLFSGFDGHIYIGNEQSSVTNIRGKTINVAGDIYCPNNAIVSKSTQASGPVYAGTNVYVGHELKGERSVYFNGVCETSGTTGRANHKVRVYGGNNTSTTAIGVYDTTNNHAVIVYQDGQSTSGGGGSKKLSVNSSVTFTATGTVSTSDERLKYDFKDLTRYEDFFYKIEPVSFRYNNGTSGRDWIGVSAQQVEKALNDIGLTNKDFAGLVINHKTKDDDDWHGIEDEYGVRYEQFIMLNTHMIQKQKKEFDIAKKENDEKISSFIKDTTSLYNITTNNKNSITNLSKSSDEYKKNIADLQYETKMLSELYDSLKKENDELRQQIKLLMEAK